MSDRDMPRFVMVVPSWSDLGDAYRDGDLLGVEKLLKSRLRSRLERRLAPTELTMATDFRVDYLASRGTGPVGDGVEPGALPDLLVCGIIMTGGEDAARLLKDNLERSFDGGAAIGADLRVSAAASARIDPFWTHWCPGEASYGLLGNRAAALRAMQAAPKQLLDAGLPGAALDRVVLIAVDTGLPPALINPLDGIKGWQVEVKDAIDITIRKPGDPLTPHGAMVAGNALALAPGVKVLDCPAIPDGITNLRFFLGWIVAAMVSVTKTVMDQQAKDAGASLPRRSWVICNAWGVFDPSGETSVVPYSTDRNHPLTAQFRALSLLGVDIVFAAGNCGQFCPNGRCSPDFTGPGRSINGANAMEQALTVGAVRSDGLWLGYSGQGPGIAGLAHDKPDLCAPSQFENDADAGPNTGTSAACGLAAGVVALLRSRWPLSEAMKPEKLRTILCSTARQPCGPQGWQGRTGHGVIDVAAAAEELAAVPNPGT